MHPLGTTFMPFKPVLVCWRCAQHRAAIVRREQGKRRGYCRECAAFLRGEISEGAAPPERPAITAQRTGWMKLYPGTPKDSDDLA
jgi:hypothetical protein